MSYPKTALNNEDVYWLLEINILEGRPQHCFNSGAQGYNQEPSFFSFLFVCLPPKTGFSFAYTVSVKGLQDTCSFVYLQRKKESWGSFSLTIRQSSGLSSGWMTRSHTPTPELWREEEITRIDLDLRVWLGRAELYKTE